MMQQQESSIQIPQYSLMKVLLIWLAAAIPMGILGWIVAPALSVGSSSPGTVRIAILAVGLAWEFALVVILLRQESSSFSWSNIRRRLWLQAPSDSGGQRRLSLWWWIIPIVILTAIYEMLLGGGIDRLWTTIFPFLAEPPSFSMAGFLETPEARAQLVGNWGFLVLYVVQAFFNTVIGEELLFRGLLLPRMAGTFGKWDWVANGILFGFYHFHQPWDMLGAAVQGVFLLAFPTRRFKSAWFGIIAHSGQSVFFTFLLLGLILGLA
jgi:membrane protease YdiL (CAAX protease family)